TAGPPGSHARQEDVTLEQSFRRNAILFHMDDVAQWCVRTDAPHPESAVANPDDARASTSRRLRIGGALAFLVWTAGDSPALAITVEEFARSPAAAAYTAGRYEAALAEIETMLRREPHDPILLRVRGMAL